MSHALRTATGEHTRARVFLRRDLGREPTRAEVATIKRDRNLKSRVTAAQIMEDFNSGREVPSSSLILSRLVGDTLWLAIGRVGDEVRWLQLRFREAFDG